MNDVEEIVMIPAPVSSTKQKEPGEVRITLSVCGCYKHEKRTFITARAQQVATILGITVKDLEFCVVVAMFSGKPEVVACYKSRDIAEMKLAQLKVKTPFITRSCHSFNIVDEG